MKFKIVKITPSMSHDSKVYEYARRLSHYSLLASEERKLSKVFRCENLDRNTKLFNESCGCFKYGAEEHHKPCKPCMKAHTHYSMYREAVNKKATALRQLNKEMQNAKSTSSD